MTTRKPTIIMTLDELQEDIFKLLKLNGKIEASTLIDRANDVNNLGGLLFLYKAIKKSYDGVKDALYEIKGEVIDALLICTEASQDDYDVKIASEVRKLKDVKRHNLKRENCKATKISEIVKDVKELIKMNKKFLENDIVIDGYAEYDAKNLQKIIFCFNQAENSEYTGVKCALVNLEQTLRDMHFKCVETEMQEKMYGEDY